jgi:hypothetical protein
MPKDPRRNQPNYKIGGAELNEFEFSHQHGALTEQEKSHLPGQSRGEGATPELPWDDADESASPEAERISRLMEEAHEEVVRRRAKGDDTQKAKPARKSAAKGTKKGGAKGATKKGGAKRSSTRASSSGAKRGATGKGSAKKGGAGKKAGARGSSSSRTSAKKSVKKSAGKGGARKR